MVILPPREYNNTTMYIVVPIDAIQRIVIGSSESADRTKLPPTRPPPYSNPHEFFVKSH